MLKYLRYTIQQKVSTSKYENLHLTDGININVGIEVLPEGSFCCKQDFNLKKTCCRFKTNSSLVLSYFFPSKNKSLLVLKI